MRCDLNPHALLLPSILTAIQPQKPRFAAAEPPLPVSRRSGGSHLCSMLFAPIWNFIRKILESLRILKPLPETPAEEAPNPDDGPLTPNKVWSQFQGKFNAFVEGHREDFSQFIKAHPVMEILPQLRGENVSPLQFLVNSLHARCRDRAMAALDYQDNPDGVIQFFTNRMLHDHIAEYIEQHRISEGNDPQSVLTQEKVTGSIKKDLDQQLGFLQGNNLPGLFQHNWDGLKERLAVFETLIADKKA